jgi:FAD/FMN-containing dehydrogenase
MPSQLGVATLGEFAGRVRGMVVTPGDADYDQARQAWNGAHDRRPGLVVRCAGVPDVIETVSFARSEGLPLAIRGGGHSVAGFSTCEGGVVLDLADMNVVQVDPTKSRAIVQGGGLWHDVDAATQQHGLAVTGGLVSSTGVAGFTLGGGIGWLARRAGLAADNLIAADLVTADGHVLRASPHEHPDLFWALTGGGGNFGVVTSFEFDLHNIGREVFAGMTVYPIQEAAQILCGYGRASDGAHDALTTVLKTTTLPSTDGIPAELRGQPVLAMVGCWSGDRADATSATSAFRSLGTVLLDTFTDREYVTWQQTLDGSFPRGQHSYFRSVFVREFGEQEAHVVASAAVTLPHPLTEIVIHQLGGAVARVAPDATAFAHRDATHIVNVIARTPTADGFDHVRGWARDVTEALNPSGPTYVNFTGEQVPDLARRSYPHGTYRRLVEVKDRYDPSNFFRLNQNIEPSPHAERVRHGQPQPVRPAHSTH